jgi:uncharacterized protein YdhG (YjbR/CyaY superfamily)
VDAGLLRNKAAVLRAAIKEKDPAAGLQISHTVETHSVQDPLWKHSRQKPEILVRNDVR